MPKIETKNHLNILIKTTESCPLKCIYCYEGDKSSRVMGEDTLNILIEKFENRSKGDISTDYTWHGSEPLMAGLNFFKKVRKIQKKFEEKGNVILNGVQTSGVLLHEKFADFFSEEDFSVGFSLDGPEKYHNLQRPFKNGSPSFNDVMKGIKLMKERDQNIGAITVLTQLNLPHLKEIYRFFQEENIPFKLNPVMNCGYASEKYDAIRLKPGDYAKAIIELFEEEFTKDAKIFNVADSLISSIFGKRKGTCSNIVSCQDNFIGVDVEGYILPCSRFTKEQLNYGNLHTDNIGKILEHPLRRGLQERYQNIEECTKNCNVNGLCYSGCMHNAYLNGDIKGIDPICLDTCMIYHYVQNRVLDQLQKDQAINGGNTNE